MCSSDKGESVANLIKNPLPDAQRAMSKRAGSTVVEVKGSHAVYVSQPQAVADLLANPSRQRMGLS
jgi:hypothetical protein